MDEEGPVLFEFVFVLQGDPHDIQRLPDTFADFVASDERPGSLHLREAACGFCRWIMDVIYDARGKMYLHIGWEKFARYHRLQAGSVLMLSYFGKRDMTVKMCLTRRDEDIPTTQLPPSLQDEDDAVVKLKSNEVRIRPMTRARAKLLKQQGASIAREGGEQLDVKLDKKLEVKLDMELDKKTSHGRAREEREACARGGYVQAGAQPGQPAVPPGHPVPGLKKDPIATVTWLEYEALRDHLQREIRVATEALDKDIQGVHLKVDEATMAVTTVQTSMTTLQASIQNLTQAVGEIRTMVKPQQPPPDEDGSVQGDNAEAANAQGCGIGHGLGRGVGDPLRGRGFVPVGAQHILPPQQEDGLGKPKFSIPRFEGCTDVEEYLTWELKIERLWHLHEYTEDRKIKFSSSEFDGYALRWWDGLVSAREEDGELPIIT
ncbi:hypothetical protein QYE76_023796 [Lolium multiflorum]|uniref:TF-B3 domain-containing protein n=1 Tax=Lolium multiflorum TaxID=4521 RepID=A0AAD8RDX9_LOLMU|nr:hypothetical protein QYE76_023796 [Lolium multiflorum]